MEDRREAVRRRLREDYAFYPARALKIVTKEGDVLPFRLKRPQLRLNLGLMAQRAAGRPQRAVLLKARQVGMSTDAQGLLIQRATQMPNHRALVVAHLNRTAGELFGIGRFMWASLPAEIQPTLAYERNSRGGLKFMQFGEPSLSLRRAGVMGLNSTVEIGSAEEGESGRGLTIHSLHLSEMAFWPDRGAATSLVEAVPETPMSLVLIESTPKGNNEFKVQWDLAVDGASGYIAHFTPWFEEQGYRLAFANEDERMDFLARVGEGEVGEDEPELMELIRSSVRGWEQEAVEWAAAYPADVLEGVDGFDGAGRPLPPLGDEELELRVLEHLYWRRRKIAGPGMKGDVSKFHEEYASTPEEAFIASGKRVFNAELVRKLLKRVEASDPVVARDGGPRQGVLLPMDERPQVTRNGLVIPTPKRAVFRERRECPADELRRARWRVWADPFLGDEALKKPPGRYIVAVDPASGEEDDQGTLAEHGIVVIDHRSLEQVAEFTVQAMDADEIAKEALLAALFFNRAWIGVERTGGWGLSILHRLARDYRYARVYRKQREGQRLPDDGEQLGWDTTHATKPEMIDRGRELLRTQTDGIRSRNLARQVHGYVRDDRGRMAPEPGVLADLLMAWLQGQMLATRIPVPNEVQRNTSTTGRNLALR